MIGTSVSPSFARASAQSGSRAGSASRRLRTRLLAANQRSRSSQSLCARSRFFWVVAHCSGTCSRVASNYGEPVPPRGVPQRIRNANGPAPRLPHAGPPLSPVERIFQEAANLGRGYRPPKPLPLPAFRVNMPPWGSAALRRREHYADALAEGALSIPDWTMPPSCWL